MIPLRDVIPSRTFPFFTISFIVLNTIAFVYEQMLPRRALEPFIHT
jgi:membrane associated rhomboid family serine protease